MEDEAAAAQAQTQAPPVFVVRPRSRELLPAAVLQLRGVGSLRQRVRTGLLLGHAPQQVHRGTTQRWSARSSEIAAAGASGVGVTSHDGPRDACALWPGLLAVAGDGFGV
jgi:hypothetical protein